MLKDISYRPTLLLLYKKTTANVLNVFGSVFLERRKTRTTETERKITQLIIHGDFIIFFSRLCPRQGVLLKAGWSRVLFISLHFDNNKHKN